MTDIATHTRPEERPDWQREALWTESGMVPVEYRYRRTAINPGGAPLPVYRVKAASRPHPWPPCKCDAPAADFITKRFIEQQ